MVIIMNKDVIQMIQTISKLIILVGIMKHKQGMNQFSIDTREWILKLTLMIQLQALMIQLIESKKTQPLIGFVNNKRKSTLLDKIVINITFILSMTKCHKINLFVTFIKLLLIKNVLILLIHVLTSLSKMKIHLMYNYYKQSLQLQKINC